MIRLRKCENRGRAESSPQESIEGKGISARTSCGWQFHNQYIWNKQHQEIRHWRILTLSLVDAAKQGQSCI